MLRFCEMSFHLCGNVTNRLFKITASFLLTGWAWNYSLISFSLWREIVFLSPPDNSAGNDLLPNLALVAKTSGWVKSFLLLQYLKNWQIIFLVFHLKVKEKGGWFNNKECAVVNGMKTKIQHGGEWCVKIHFK